MHQNRRPTVRNRGVRCTMGTHQTMSR